MYHKATQQRYFQNHKETITEKRKSKYQNDEEFRKKCIEVSKKYYQEKKKRLLEQKQNENPEN